ncbi:hypothetical protein E3T55_08085, partial [Cryobacterium frigoriphilum]
MPNITALATTTEEIVLNQYRTDHTVSPSHCLTMQTIDTARLEPGQVRVRNDFLQITAVMADLMTEHPGLPMPPYLLGTPLWGGAVGTVTESAADLQVGSVVTHMSGWREETVAAAETFWPVPIEVLPGAEYVLNQGVTAHHGIVDIAQVRAGDMVFVSGAAGGVGSLAGSPGRRGRHRRHRALARSRRHAQHRRLPPRRYG